jgi:hypothetical protein
MGERFFVAKTTGHLGEKWNQSVPRPIRCLGTPEVLS